MKKILILSGSIHSGKTTRLMRWATQKKNIDGIFQPVIDEKRFIYHIASRRLKKLETEESVGITTIGEYRFSNHTFDWAKKILLDCINKNLDWIVVDEIGPLELDGKALEPAVSKLISDKNIMNAQILCVVREELIDKFIDHYQLDAQYEISNNLP
jgi:nucleoside-triphosphatase THEP1